MSTGASHPGLQDAALLLDLFRDSGLKQLDLRTADLEVYVARGGVWRRASAGDPAAGPGPLALTAPHLGTVAQVARPGDRVAAGEPWATLEVLGAQTALTHDTDLRVLTTLAREGDLVEYGATLLEAQVGAPRPAAPAP